MKTLSTIIFLLITTFAFSDPFLYSAWVKQDVPNETIKYYTVKIDNGSEVVSLPQKTTLNETWARLKFDLVNLSIGEHTATVVAYNIFNLYSAESSLTFIKKAPEAPKDLKSQ